MSGRARINIFMGKDQLWRFNVQGANGEIVTQSEGYASRANARRAVNRLTAILGELDVTVQPEEPAPLAPEVDNGQA